MTRPVFFYRAGARRDLDLPNLTYRIDPVSIPTPEGPSEVGRIVFTGEGRRGVRDILSGPGEDDRTERDVARDIILAGCGSPDGITWKDLAASIKAEGVSERTGRRARDELRKAALIDFTGGGGEPYKWHLTEAGMADALARGGVLGHVDNLANLPFDDVDNQEEVGQPVAKPQPLSPLRLSRLATNTQTSPARPPEEVGHPPERCTHCGQQGGLDNGDGVLLHAECALELARGENAETCPECDHLSDHFQWCSHADQLEAEEVSP